MTNPLVRLTPQQLAQIPEKGQVIIDGKRYQVQITQQPDPPAARLPSHYQTAKSQGIPPQTINLPKLPTSLTLTLSAVIALCFLVAASMFSIGLTSYSNSVERTNQTRSFIRVE